MDRMTNEQAGKDTALFFTRLGLDSPQMQAAQKEHWQRNPEQANVPFSPTVFTDMARSESAWPGDGRQLTYGDKIAMNSIVKGARPYVASMVGNTYVGMKEDQQGKIGKW